LIFDATRLDTDWRNIVLQQQEAITATPAVADGEFHLIGGRRIKPSIENDSNHAGVHAKFREFPHQADSFTAENWAMHVIPSVLLPTLSASRSVAT
jgi:hypothetical protein